MSQSGDVPPWQQRPPELVMPSSAVAPITDANETDVVLGRGSAQAWRPGNVAFHRLLDQYAPRYYASQSTKLAKTRMIQEIYRQMAQSGRFLTKQNDSDHFVQLTESEAKARISDAMRYRQRRRKRKRPPSTGSAAAASSPTTEPSSAVSSQTEERPGYTGAEERNREPNIDNSEQKPEAVPSPDPLQEGQQQQNPSELELFSDKDLSSVLDPV